MNYTKLFYWLVVADNARNFFTTMIVIFTLISVISTIAYFINSNDGEEDSQKMSRKWMWYSYPFAMVFWLMLIFTPSKRDALLIVAGGQTLNFLSTDSSAKQIPSELSGFILTELKSMAMESKVELGIEEQKDKILREAKSMTSDQIIEKMKSDTLFKQTILN